MTTSGAVLINDEAAFSTHDAALRYLVRLTSHEMRDHESQYEILEYETDSQNPEETSCEWHYDSNGRLIWSPDSIKHLSLPPDESDVDYLEIGTVVRLIPWPYCIQVPLPKSVVGVISSVVDYYGNELELDTQHGPFQYCVEFVDELGCLDHCHVQGAMGLEHLPPEAWQGDETIATLVAWVNEDVVLPDGIQSRLEDGSLCARCLNRHVVNRHQ